MKITDYETYVIKPGRKGQVILRLITADGAVGIGEGTCQTKVRSVKSAIDVMSEYFLGSELFDHEKLYQEMYRHEWFSDNVIGQTAIAAVDTAMWDLKGKLLGAPLYDLLGGSLNKENRIRAYGTGRIPKNDDLKAIRVATEEVVDSGLTAMKFDPFRGAWQHLSPDQRELGLQKVRVIREAAGTDMDLMIDLHGRFSPGTANQVIRQLEEFDLAWVEEPVPPDNNEALRRVAHNSPVPIAAGEHEHSKYSHQELIRDTDVDILQPDLVNAGGPTEAKKIAALAESNHLRFAPHNSNGVIGTTMTLHVDLSTPNFMVQEVTSIDDAWHSIVDDPVTIQNGYLRVPDGPGLGIELDLSAVEEFQAAADQSFEPKLGRWQLEHT